RAYLDHDPRNGRPGQRSLARGGDPTGTHKAIRRPGELVGAAGQVGPMRSEQRAVLRAARFRVWLPWRPARLRLRSTRVLEPRLHAIQPGRERRAYPAAAAECRYGQ